MWWRCWGGRWPPCPNGCARAPRWPGGRSRCAPTPGTSPGTWPAPPPRRRWPSRSARSGSPPCGGPWPGSQTTPGGTRPAWRTRRSRLPYAPADWPQGMLTALLVRRVKLDPEQVPADPRSRRRQTLQPGPAECCSGAGARTRHLRLQLHPHQPRRVHPGQSRRPRALCSAPHQHREGSATASTAPRCAPPLGR